MASAIICHENGIHLDGVVIAEVMFSHEKNISAEHPKHVEWLYNTAIPTLEKQFGFDVIVLRADEDYVGHFNKRITRSSVPQRVGKKHGFVIASMCALRRDCKMRPLDKWCKQQGDFEKILGIAYDDKKRLDSLHKQKNARSVLEEFMVTEEMTYDIDRKYNLLSPFYELGRKRQGCWFCQNASVKEMAAFAKDYPDLWNELRKLANDTEVASPNFSYGKTFQTIDDEISLINDQVSFFDFVECGSE